LNSDCIFSLVKFYFFLSLHSLFVFIPHQVSSLVMVLSLLLVVLDMTVLVVVLVDVLEYTPGTTTTTRVNYSPMALVAVMEEISPAQAQCLLKTKLEHLNIRAGQFSISQQYGYWLKPVFVFNISSAKENRVILY